MKKLVVLCIDGKLIITVVTATPSGVTVDTIGGDQLNSLSALAIHSGDKNYIDKLHACENVEKALLMSAGICLCGSCRDVVTTVTSVN